MTGIVNTLVSVLYNLVLAFVNIILAPIDVLVQTCFPWFSSAISYLNNLIDLITPYISYIVNMSCLSSFALSIIIFTITFKITSTISTWTIKLAMKWYYKLKN